MRVNDCLILLLLLLLLLFDINCFLLCENVQYCYLFDTSLVSSDYVLIFVLIFVFACLCDDEFVDYVVKYFSFIVLSFYRFNVLSCIFVTIFVVLLTKSMHIMDDCLSFCFCFCFCFFFCVPGVCFVCLFFQFVFVSILSILFLLLYFLCLNFVFFCFFVFVVAHYN